MKIYSFLKITVLGLFVTSCNESVQVTTVKKLGEGDKTIFLPTIEHVLPSGKNSIYCSSLLFSWNEIRKTLKEPILVNAKVLPDLNLVNNSTSYIGSLEDNEYKASGLVEGDSIRIKAEFEKSLPLKEKLTSFSKELVFQKNTVASFGCRGDRAVSCKNIQILYYKNDQNFIIRLIPKDTLDEIILVKSDKKLRSMSKILDDVELKTETGSLERESEKNSWKYFLTFNDEVMIPKLNLNIENDFIKIKGKRFKSDNKVYEIATAWQRTALILDENGTEVESDPKSESSPNSEDGKEKFKKLRFDKPFFLMVKKRKTRYPYFGIWINNLELLQIEQ